jgi:hypothetical protein
MAVSCYKMGIKQMVFMQFRCRCVLLTVSLGVRRFCVNGGHSCKRFGTTNSPILKDQAPLLDP